MGKVGIVAHNDNGALGVFFGKRGIEFAFGGIVKMRVRFVEEQ